MVLTVDVEDWFCVRNMGEAISFSQWNAQELRVRVGLDFLLEELQKRRVRATFFVLGWIAERCPDLVPTLVAEGHEIGSHGYNHQPLDEMTPEAFEEDVRRSLEVLEPQAGGPIRGYRAPSFSVTEKTLWALDRLSALGFAYDSSVYPIRHPNYGIADFPLGPVKMGPLMEVPMSTLRVAGLRLPISGGGYFRLYPYGLTRRWLRRAEAEREVVLYFHPWEFDPEQPRVDLPPLRRFRHYVGLGANRRKFRRLLEDFTFRPLGELVAERAGVA